MKRKRKRKCKHCGELYRPDPRNQHHQRYCSAKPCQRARHQANLRAWRARPEHRDYFSGPEEVARVQAWRKEHPGYWRKKPPALQDETTAQPAAAQADKPRLALQDVILMQAFVLVGVISILIGANEDALQDEIASAFRHLHARGQMILDPKFGIQTKGNADAGKTFVMSG